MYVVAGCLLLVYRQLDDSHRVTVYCRDEDGRTGLHHAARMGGGLQHRCIGSLNMRMGFLLTSYILSQIVTADFDA